jgi:hypothetical protein
MTNGAICVQAFNKADTIVQTLEALALCEDANKFDLLVVQDGLEGSRFRDKYSNEHAITKTAIKEKIPQIEAAFKSVQFLPQTAGRGTAGTAKVAIDLAFETHDWVVFSEDDVIFERDALVWFQRLIIHDGFLRENVWAIAGESKHFDSRGHVVSKKRIAQALETAREAEVISKYCYQSWLPSSCFATNKEKWAEFADTRGEARGPKKVNDRCKDEGKYSLWPIIARCRDIGMHHTIGYSMTIHKTAEKIPQKNSYLRSGVFPPIDGPVSEYLDKKRLYQRFSQDFEWLAQED